MFLENDIGRRFWKTFLNVFFYIAFLYLDQYTYFDNGYPIHQEWLNC